ncbi:MAG TPA: Asp-tRNA(Asn)/Glu-tRNA(Gln) amidotransferase subunit GatB [Verrucomicrobiae bacterium]|jgi:aspartyl-tRNA(Asn)/glutamyl-tRNA(Gln) amidotransferase subunit B|nr:Asp-tRNA(Asn)/Glu-tRNA(Gln) amidotransferase subunit GatB [Verrucomicrobiae bacterium]
MPLDDYEPVIGLEVHTQLDTKSKIFCSCSTRFGCEPNQNTCPTCMGMPGSLPVLNEEALRLGIKVGLALNCKISERLKFDRKNYFYPDLPKAYQISQFDMPVNGPGWLMIELKGADGGLVERKIRVHRAHLEEDAGKLLHEGIEGASLVDFNRAGVPLLEIVSEPDLRSPEEAYAYLTALKAILQYLEVSDCNMEEGSLRCDANVSIRKKGETKLGTKAEVKNLNSFKAVQKAIQYEIERQAAMLDNGERVVQETRLWNDDKGQTFLMRSKEEAHDYRYFPEPDLVPFTLSAETVEAIRKTLPELPAARAARLAKNYGLSAYDAAVLVQEKPLANYFEDCLKSKANPKMVSNWIQSELLALLNLNKLTIENSPVKAEALAGLIALIENNTINGKIAKDVLPLMFETGKPAGEIVKEKGWVQVTDTKFIEEIADGVIEANPKSVTDFRAGKNQALGFLVGQVMKASQGKANPKLANEILVKKLQPQ